MYDENDYEDRIVAFIDILGFKNIIRESANDAEILGNVNKALDIINSYKRLNDKFEIPSVTGEQITTFSDNVVITYPLEYRDALFFLIIDLIHIQLELAGLGILVRGGVSIGKCVHQNDRIFGPAMNAAYELESKVAVYPRIIIPREVYEIGYDNCPSKNELDFNQTMRNMVKMDVDGNYYIDFLRQYQELDYPEYYYLELLQSIRKQLLCQVELNKNNTYILSKYYWFINYWNRTIDDENFSKPYDPDAELSVEELWQLYANLKIDLGSI